MGATTKIEWCDHTFNPWIGCTKISHGCTNCYAADFAARFYQGNWGPQAKRRLCNSVAWEAVDRWNDKAAAAGRPALVFCGSMCDVFEDYDGPSDIELQRRLLWQRIERTPNLFWLLLTKRPANIARMVPGGPLCPTGLTFSNWLKAPRDNVMMMTSVEDQATADTRIEELADAPCLFRGLSVEPLLEDVSLLFGRRCIRHWQHHREEILLGDVFHWVIAGGESGPKARECKLEWLRSIKEQAVRHAVPCFIKQLGSRPINPVTGKLWPITDPKGGDPSEWPKHLRFRQWPNIFGRRLAATR